MKNLAILLIVLVASGSVFAQADEPGAAASLTVDFWSQGTLQGGTLAGATDSGLAGYCAASDGNDVFYEVTPSSQGIKAQVITAAFDAVIELRDGSDPDIVLDCVDANFGNGGEELWVTGLTAGTSYYLCVYSTNGSASGAFQVMAEYLPMAEVRSGYHPNPATDIDLPGYKIAETTRRNTNTAYPINMTAFIQATRWRIVDTSDLSVYYADVAGNNQLLTLNAVAGPLCFNKVYDVQCQVMVEGQWCGYSVTHAIHTEAQPNSTLLPAWVGGTYDLSSSIKAVFVGNQQQLYWRLTTDNGNTQIDFQYPGDATTWLNFPDVECMRFNKIYQVEIASEYCGVLGSYSDPVNVFTSSVPYTKVRDEYCGTDQFVGGTILCDFIASIDTYVWQVAPIVQDDPEMVPTGPAMVVYTNGTDLALTSLVPEGLEQGKAYRVGVKPQLGNLDSCDELQEGDYGYFCQIVTINTGFVGEEIGAPVTIESEDIAEERGFEFASNDESRLKFHQGAGGERRVVLDLNDSGLEGNAYFTVHDLQGKIVDQMAFASIHEANIVQYSMNSELPSGVYVFSITDGKTKISEKVFVR